jgi:hypothetical protein
MEGGKDHVKLSKSVIKHTCLTEFVRFYSEEDNGDLVTMLTGVGNLNGGMRIDAKQMKKMLKARGKNIPTARGAGGGGSTSSNGADWSISDVSDWLASMQMGAYKSSFSKEKVDGVALLALQDQDLKGLGVASLGERKKLTEAIAKLNQSFGGGGGGPPQGGGGGPPPGGQPGAQPVATIGLVARNVGGQVKIFDTETGEEVHDIAAHQIRKQEEAAAKQQGGGGGMVAAPPPQAQAPPPRPAPSGGGGGGHESEEWYQRDLAKSDIPGHLAGRPDGSFVIRDSASNPGSFGFSYNSPGGKVEHKMVVPKNGGFAFKGSENSYPSLKAFIDNYCVNGSSAIKCKLCLPGQQPEAAAAPPPRSVLPRGRISLPHRGLLAPSWSACSLVVCLLLCGLLAPSWSAALVPAPWLRLQ